MLAGCATPPPPPPVRHTPAPPRTPPAAAAPAPAPAAVPAPVAPPAAPTAATPPAEPPPAPPPSPIAAEQQWMRSLFDGTPVAFTDEADGALRVDVPMEFGFDADGAKMKPALRAVLDKLSQSLARQRGTHLQLGPPEPQVRERLAAMRDFLSGKKVSRSRLPATPNLSAGVVMLRLSPAPPPVVKLEDASPLLPMPATRPAPAPAARPAPPPAVKPPANR